MARDVKKRDWAAFEKWRNRHMRLVNDFMDETLDQRRAQAPENLAALFDAMGYALLSPGKRLRPLLALAAAEAVGGHPREALNAAVSVEMIHAYSLIHDDLPAMDDDDMRRGRPACHIAFDEGTAILAGDALLTLAFEVAASPKYKNEESISRSHQFLLELAKAAGPLGMVGGQVLDLAMEKQSFAQIVDGNMVRDMEFRKTGEMIAISLCGGAIMAGAGGGILKRLKRIGLLAGLAFQVKDDLLDLSGDPAVLGKAVGSDAARGKCSFPAIVGRENAEKELRSLMAETMALTSIFNQEAWALRHLLESLVNRDK